MHCPTALTKTVVVFISLMLATSAFAAPRPAKRNQSFNPAAAAQFPSVTTGVNVKIKSAAISKDGVITCRFTLTDSKGLGLDVDGIQTAGTMSIRFVAAYIPAGKTQYVAYTTTVLKATINSNP